MKRLFALLMAAVMVLTLGACAKAPEENWDQDEVAIMLEEHLEWKEVEGGVELTAYKGKYKHLQVPEKVDGKFVVSLGTALVGNQRVLSLILPDTFETLDSAWFTGCDSLLSIFGYNVLELQGDGLELAALEALQLPSLARLSSSDVKGCPSLKYLQIPRAREITGYTEDGTWCPWPEGLVSVELVNQLYARVKAPAGAEEVEGRIWSLVYEPLVGLDEERYPEDAFRKIHSTAGQDYCAFFGVHRLMVNGMDYVLS